MNVYILNKKPEEVIFNVHAEVQAAFLQSMKKEFFQNQQVVVTPETREALVKVVVSVCSKFVATEIKHMSGIHSIDKNKVKDMFYVCIEKFLDELRF